MEKTKLIKKYEKRQKKLNLLFIGVLLIIGYITYLLINSPKIKVIKYLYNLDSIYNNNINENYKNLYNNDKLGFKLKSYINTYNSSAPINFNLEYYEDNTKRENYFDLTTDINNDLFNLNIINKNQNLYYKIKNANQNYYYINSKYISLFKKNIIDKNIKKSLSKTILKYISNEKFYTTEYKDILNGNETSLNKTSLTLYSSEIKNMLNKFREELRINSNGNNYNYMYDIIDTINNNLNDNSKYIYSFYEGYNGIVKQDIEIINNDNNEKNILAFYNYDNKKGIKIINNDLEIFDLLIAESGDRKIISGTINNKFNISGKIDSNKILIYLNDNNDENTIEINGDISNEIIKEDIEYNTTYNINIISRNNNNIISKSNIKIDLRLIAGVEIKEVNLDDAKENSEITTEEKNKITKILSNILKNE